MTFWNERVWFERSGARYIFRTSPFSRGYDVSESEKDRLFRGLTRLTLRLFWEGLVAMAAVALLLMTGWFETATPFHWFIALAILSVGLLAATGLARRDRLIARVLGNREAGVPRLPFGTAISTPRPQVSTQYSAPLLRSVAVLMWICLVVLNGAFAYLLYSAYDSAQRAAEAGDATGGAAFAAKLANPDLWMALIGVNAGIVICAFMLAREARRLSRLPEAAQPARPGNRDQPG